MKDIFKKRSILIYLSITFVIITGITMFINGWVIFGTISGVYLQALDATHEAFSVIISDILKDYKSMPWLIDYWQEHADTLDLPDTDSESKDTAWQEAHSAFEKTAVEAITEEDIREMTPGEQKLFAEYCYVRLSDSMAHYWNIIQIYHLRCYRVTEEGEVFTFIDISDEDQIPTYDIVSNAYVGEKELRSYQNRFSSGKDSIDVIIEKDENGERLGIALTPIYVDGKLLCVVRNSVKMKELNQDLKRRLAVIETVILAVMAIGAAVTLFFILLIILRPVRQIGGVVREYTDSKELEDLLDNLEGYKQSKNEVGHLGENIAEMAEEVDRYYNEVIELTAEKERLEGRLAMASDIKGHLMPNTYPAFKEIPSFDIYADQFTMTGCGGDYYDYFRLDENNIVVLVADIYDGGIESALYMIVFKVMLQSIVMMGLPLAQAVRIFNNRLCQKNDDNLCLAAWIGIYDISTGKITAINAGGETPLLLPDTFDEKPEVFAVSEDIKTYPLGIIENMDFYSYTFTLPEGWGLFLHSDGLLNPFKGDAVFTEAQLRKELTEAAKRTASETGFSVQRVIGGMQESFFKKVGDAPLIQDVTMACVKHCAVKKAGTEAKTNE